ncbi:MAG: chitinase [Verrucomicrobiota bacterium]|jgi:hypothetical protein
MNHAKPVSVLTSLFQAAVFLCAALASGTTPAATLWTGTNLTWTKSASTPSDTVLPGKVVLTRAGRQVLYNTALGETAASPDAVGSVSPAGTLWAFGTFGSHTVFQTMESMRNGNLGARILNQPMVMWITNANDDIFVAVTFTVWGEHGIGGGSVSYNRSTPPPPTPTVSMTSPAAGAVFAAPANVSLTANATVSAGTVTNVSYFAGASLLGRASVSPFSVTASNLPAGSYLLTAVATAAGISRTSAVVNISVVSPVAVSLSSPAVNNGVFHFNYTADAGLRYVIQRASSVGGQNLFDWTSVATNVAPGNLVSYSETLTTNRSRFFRVGRLPNP